MYDIIIRNGFIYDGIGSPPYIADIGVKDGIIQTIGDLREASAERTVDAEGKYVTPGFFDMHSHADLSIVQFPDAESLLGQGVTTAFCGHCGMGMAPAGSIWKSQNDDLFAMERFMPFASCSTFPGVTPTCMTEQLRPAYKEYTGVDMDWVTVEDYRNKLKKSGIGINLFMLVGYQQIRQSVLGFDAERKATAAEIDAMEAIVDEAMRAGAPGISFGFDYTPDMSAGEEELQRIVTCVKRHDGIVAAHTRNGKAGDPEWQPIDGIREFLELGKKTGAHMHISHIQPGFKITPKDQKLTDASAVRTLAVIQEYRDCGIPVTWDVLHPEPIAFFYYPELCSPLMYYLRAYGGKSRLKTMLQDELFLKSLAAKIDRGEHIVFPRFDDTAEIKRCVKVGCIGKTIRQLAEESGMTSGEMLLTVLREDMNTLIMPNLAYKKMAMSAVFWNAEDATIGTDNCVFNYDYEALDPELPAFRSAPTAFCGIVRFLKLSEDQPFESVVRKLTGNAAKALRLKDRGVLKAGYRADLVVLDRSILDDCENFEDPRQKPKGIEYVIVNGKIAVDGGVHSHVRAGVLLKRKNGKIGD